MLESIFPCLSKGIKIVIFSFMRVDFVKLCPLQSNILFDWIFKWDLDQLICNCSPKETETNPGTNKSISKIAVISAVESLWAITQTEVLKPQFIFLTFICN